jgi:hypothetical protein
MKPLCRKPELIIGTVNDEGEILYLTDTGKSFALTGLSKAVDIPLHKIYQRIHRYGLTSPLVLHHGRITREVLAEKALELIDESKYAARFNCAPLPYFDRKLCRRGLDQCVHYNACQSSRCGLEDSEPWDNRTTTDHCYTSPVGISPAIYALNYAGQLGLSA